MTMTESTPITTDENGDQSHESWIRVGASKIQGTATRLFDSEISHQHWVRVTIQRCTRKRDLNHDWLYNKMVLLEFDMSEAQWGAFVSSFGSGGGVPATLTWFGERVSEAPVDSRMDESHKEVKGAADAALAAITKAQADLEEAFERKAGRAELREKIRTLHHLIGNAPSNMEFVAKSLTEHVENVVTKARFDVEAMVLNAQQAGVALNVGEILEIEETTADA